MDYSQITERQIQTRIDTLPEKLGNLFNSDRNLEAVRQICRNHVLADEDKVLIVEQLVGMVLLGFISPAEISREISENVPMNKQHADDIAADLEKKIFTPIKAELEEVYKPLASMAGVVKPEAPIPSVKAETPVETKEEIGLEVKMPEEGAPKIIPEAAPVAPTGPVMLSQPAPVSFEAPAIIHKEEVVKQVAQPKSLGGLMGIFRKAGESKPETPKIVAEVQYAGQPAPSETAAPQIAKTEQTKLRIVHYGDLKTPVSSDIFGSIKPGGLPAEAKGPEISAVSETPATQFPKPFSVETPSAKILEGGSSEKSAVNVDKVVDQILSMQPQTGIKPEAKAAPLEPKKIETAPKVKVVNFGMEEKTVQDIKPAVPSFVETLSNKKPEIPKPEPMPSKTVMEEIKLKDIPVSEDVIDLRNL